MEFQNTIAYGTFTNGGAELTLSDGVWTQFPFIPRCKICKNTNVPATNTFKIQVQETGMYFVEFSFIAQDGDGKSYSIRPYVNGIEYGSGGTAMQIKFYQQPTTQKYEVSTHGLFALAKDDTVEWKIYVATASATTFYINTLKMNLVNLQQIGLH